MRLWLLGRWTALRGLPWLCPGPILLSLNMQGPGSSWASHRWASLSWRWRGRFPESAPKWGIVGEWGRRQAKGTAAWPAPSFLFTCSELVPPAGRRYRKLPPTPKHTDTHTHTQSQETLWPRLYPIPSFSHAVSQACLGERPTLLPMRVHPFLSWACWRCKKDHSGGSGASFGLAVGVGLLTSE